MHSTHITSGSAPPSYSHKCCIQIWGWPQIWTFIFLPKDCLDSLYMCTFTLLMSASTCLCVCIFVCLYVCMSAFLHVRVSVCLCVSVRMSVCQCPYVCVSVSVCLCVSLSVCLCVSLSVCLCVLHNDNVYRTINTGSGGSSEVAGEHNLLPETSTIPTLQADTVNTTYQHLLY